MMKHARYIVPSFRYLDSEMMLAQKNAELLGFELQPLDKELKKFWKFSERPKQRISHVNRAFKDPNSQVIFAIKGGYGAIELLPHLDYESFVKNNKKLFGFSDITAILNAVHQKTGLITYHSPNIGSMARLFDDTETTNIQKLMNGESIQYSIANKKTQNFTQTTYEGMSVGGNLVLICDMIGTEFEIDAKGKILFLECQATMGYRIYVKLVQLYLAGILSDCSCVVLGTFLKSQLADKYIKSFFKRYDVPVLWWREFGHGYPNYPFPIGAKTTVDIEQGILHFEQ